jgi:hypothetical protein
MGYATRQLVENILAQTLTSATTPTLEGRGKLINFGNQIDKNLITNAVMDNFISMADTFINSALSVLYKTPLIETADAEFVLALATDPYSSDIIVEDNKASLLVPGDNLIFVQDSLEERGIVSSVENSSTFTLENALGIIYEPSYARIIRVKYPNPIPNISARMAAASIYDRYFLSQSSSEKSDYGKNQRSLARVDINNILNGRVVLHGQHRIGKRFASGNLIDRYGLPSVDSDGTRDIGELP